jgi:hypothetical protein
MKIKESNKDLTCKKILTVLQDMSQLELQWLDKQ